MANPSSTIADNLQRVKERIARAAVEAGRAADEITLVGVTKYVGANEATALFKAGCHDLGESRPQQLWDKAPQIPGACWHLVGHLQRNKIARTLPLATWIHSIDSERLLGAIDAEAAKQNVRPQLLLEVNCSGDVEKHGFSPDELKVLAPRLGDYRAVDIRGLMTMAAREGDVATAAGNFRTLRALRDELQAAVPGNVRLTELSMGMTGDFKEAIAEGATLVRIGSALWEGVHCGG